MFTKEIKSVFDKLLPKEKKVRKHNDKIQYTRRKKIFSKNICTANRFWDAGVIDKRIGKLIYMIKNPQKTSQADKILGRYELTNRKSR